MVNWLLKLQYIRLTLCGQIGVLHSMMKTTYSTLSNEGNVLCPDQADDWKCYTQNTSIMSNTDGAKTWKDLI